MITLLKKHGYLETLWKNGKGKTLQIAIFPPEAELSLNNFIWRISSATISLASPFSRFPGFDRLLAIWTGTGLKLNQTELFPLSTFRFSGDEDIFCEPIGTEKVLDLGVIYNRHKIKASMSAQTYSSGSSIIFGPGVHFLFLIAGNGCQVNQLALDMGDTLRIEHSSQIHIISADNSDCVFYLINLEPLNPL